LIARLSGTLFEKGPDRVLIDVCGVGYLAFISFQTFQELPPAGENAALLIHTHVREDAITLFGFSSPREKKLFEMLIAVSGVGPRLALTLLSGIPLDDLITALAGGDARRLTAVPGIGRKTADRLALELKEKAVKLFAPPRPESAGVELEDVVSALVNFGYKKSEADRVVDSLARAGPPADFAGFLRAALAALSGA
jgi:Holliday junction DNA helicase RuvA